MSLKTITKPTIEPITLDEIKAWCRIDATGDTVADSANEALLTSLISSAREEVEVKLGRSLLTQTLELTLAHFPRCGNRVELPRPPFDAVTSVTYYDTENVSTIMSNADYLLMDVSDSIPPSIVPTPGSYWPDTNRRPDAVAIRYTTGWPDVDSVPDNIKIWIKVRAATLWANRENVVAGNNTVGAIEMPNRFLDALLDPWIIREVA